MSKKYLCVVDINRASRGIRFLNYIIDYLVIIIGFIIIGLILGFLADTGITKPLEILERLGENTLLDRIITMIVYVIYLFSIEYFTKGRSIGKFITGTKAISIDGTTPTMRDFLIRNFIRLIPFDGISFFTENGWHDSWSETRVVNLKKYNEDFRMESEMMSIGNRAEELDS